MNGPGLETNAIGNKVILEVGTVDPTARKRHVLDDGEFVKINLPGRRADGDCIAVFAKKGDGGTQKIGRADLRVPDEELCGDEGVADLSRHLAKRVTSQRHGGLGGVGLA